MISLITALILAMSFSVADAKPHKQKQSAKRAVPHQHHAAKKPRHKHATHRHHQYHVTKARTAIQGTCRPFGIFLSRTLGDGTPQASFYVEVESCRWSMDSRFSDSKKNT